MLHGLEGEQYLHAVYMLDIGGDCLCRDNVSFVMIVDNTTMKELRCTNW